MTVFKPRGPARFAHQRAGLRDIIANRGTHALLFDAGTGKTMTTLDYSSLLALKSPTRKARVLVIAPLAAVDTWVEQAEQFVADGVSVHAEVLGGSIRQRSEALAARGNDDYSTGARRSPARVVRREEGDTSSLTLIAVNLDSFASRASATKGGTKTMTDLMVEGVKRFRPDLIVVDESHRIKSPTSNTSRALARVGRLCRRRMILTGTVMPHSPLDVYGQWRFLDPTAFGPLQADGTRRPATYGYFRGRYAKMGGWMGKEVTGFHRLDEMEEIMARRSTVARKEDALDLPPVTDTIVRVDLSPAEARAYKSMKDNLAVALSSGALASVPNRLAQMMRLRQITSGYLPDDSGNVSLIGKSKARVISSLVHDSLAGEDRVVVFAHFRHEIDLLVKMLARKGTEVVTVTGDTSPRERAAIRHRFGSSDPARIVLIAQTRTMSLAVNELVTASHAIFASLPNQRDDIEQSRARLDRQGQARPITFWTTLAPGTVDEVIWRSYQDRTSLEAALLKHIAEGG